MEAAAKDWGVPVAELAVDKGVITHAKSNRSTTYGKIATAASKLEVPKDADITLKDPKTWKIAGKPLNRLDTPDKLTGKQIYSIDVTLPGMLNATIIDAPLFGAKLRSYDEAKAKSDAWCQGHLSCRRDRRCRRRGHLLASEKGGPRLHDPKPADRARHAWDACASAFLARRQQ
jgi:isoquinoline 1-oxidoreductase beta subunit